MNVQKTKPDQSVKPLFKRGSVFVYLAIIVVLSLLGMSIYELTRHILFSHQQSWTMHLYNIGSSVLVAAAAGWIALQKVRSSRRETLMERQLRRKLQTEIAERKHTEKKLRESESRVRAVVDSAVDGIVTIDHSGTITTFNRAAETIFGYSLDEIIGQNITVLMPETFAREHDAYLGNYLQTGHKKIIGIGREVEGLRKDGDIFPMELAVSEFFVGPDRFFAGIVRDISQRRKMETALQDERSFVSAVLSTSAALIMVLDRQGRIVRFNEACETVSGYTADEVKGGTLWDLFLIGDQAGIAQTTLQEPKAGEFPYEIEQEWRTKDGTLRLISWKNTALLDDQDLVQDICCTGIDVTEQRNAEEKLKKHQAELAHIDRVSIMGEMATSLAHELNQPLAAAYAYSKACVAMQKNGQGNSEKFVDALENIGKTTERAGSIIRRVRGFIGRKELRRAEFDIHEVIDNIISLTQSQSRSKGVNIEVETEHDLPKFIGDQVQVEQVLLNLVKNSIEALMDREKKLVNIAAIREDEASIRISVKDTGPGFGVVGTDEMFQPFCTSKSDGMGMGLAISRSIIEAHGGKLWAEQQDSGGAALFFTLPVDQS